MPRAKRPRGGVRGRVAEEEEVRGSDRVFEPPNVQRASEEIRGRVWVQPSHGRFDHPLPRRLFRPPHHFSLERFFAF